MKRALTIALVVSGFSSPLSAFDVDLSRNEALTSLGIYTVSDLAEMCR